MRCSIVNAMLASISLAACAPEAEAPVQTEAAEQYRGDAARTIATDRSPADPAPASITAPRVDEAALDADAQAVSEADARMIARDYHGVWDSVDGDCPTMSDLRMTIAADKIGFYESEGRVQSIERRPNGDRLVTLAMTGEGESWTQNVKLELDSTGTRMVTTMVGGDGPEVSVARRKCDG